MELPARSQQNLILRVLSPLSMKDGIGLMLVLAWRACIALRWGLGSDEAHYALYGRHLDWSYFDHPPLIGWVEALFQNICGSDHSELVVRLPAMLCGFISALLLAKLMRALKQSDLNARGAAWISQTLFLPTALWIMPLPDTLLLVFSLWLFLWMLRDVKLHQRSAAEFVELGFILGCAGLAKYSAVLLLVSLFIWVVWKRERIPVLKTLAASFIAMILVLPVFYWNWKNHWISFQYQTSHVLGASGLDFQAFLSSFISPLIAYGPFLLPLTFFKSSIGRDARKFLLIFCGPMWIFFLLSGLKGFVLPHWLLIPYVIWISCMAATHLTRALKPLAILQAAVCAACLLELTFPIFPFPDGQSPFADLVGWPEIKTRIDIYQAAHPERQISVGVPNWTLGSRARFYMEKTYPVFVLDDRFDQFDLWEAGQKKTNSLIVLHFPGFELDKRESDTCADRSVIDTLVFKVAGHIANRVELILCNLKAPSVALARPMSDQHQTPQSL